MSNLNRREFVVAATAACACAVCGEGGVAEAAPPAGTKIDVGTPADYPSNGISDRFKKPHKVLVIRSGERIYAVNAVCTHKGCVVNVKDNQIKCPCHGSGFSEHGTVIDGPAKRSLSRYAISLNDQNHIIVNKSKQFAEKDWEKPESFVTVS